MIGIVVITFNSEDVIDDCLDACQRVPGTLTLVVDNASSDSTVALVRARPEVRLIANGENRGFGAAANQGLTALSLPYMLLLNPDAVIVGGLRSLERAVSLPGAGAAGGRLVDLAGSDQEGFHVRGFPAPWTLCFEVLGVNRLWPGNPLNRRYRPRLGIIRPSKVDQPAGAFLMIRREAWQRIGGFDEQFYPIWFEDVDFCKRLREAGFTIMYVPEAVARHRGGHAAWKLTWTSRQFYWYRSMLAYARKHFSPSGRAALSLAIVIGFGVRSAARLLRTGNLEVAAIYSRIVRLAALCAAGRQDSRRDVCLGASPASPLPSEGRVVHRKYGNTAKQ